MTSLLQLDAIDKSNTLLEKKEAENNMFRWIEYNLDPFEIEKSLRLTSDDLLKSKNILSCLEKKIINMKCTNFSAHQQATYKFWVSENIRLIKQELQIRNTQTSYNLEYKNYTKKLLPAYGVILFIAAGVCLFT